MKRTGAPDLFKAPTKNSVSRRTFLRYAALGAAGAALALPRPLSVFAAPAEETGQVTLDGLMVTYFTASPNAAQCDFTLGSNFSTTFTLKLRKTPGLALTATVPPGDADLKGGFTQHNSALVPGAMILRSKLGLPLDGAKGDFTSAVNLRRLQIYGLKTPRLQFSGSPQKLRFCFADASRDSADLAPAVNASTGASMLSQHVTQPAALFPPRFCWLDLSGEQDGTTFDCSLPSTLLSRNDATATITAKIVDQTGFRSRELRQAFAVGNDIEITHHSIQEFPSPSLMALQMAQSVPGVSRVYIDRVFKTFVTSDMPGSEAR